MLCSNNVVATEPFSIPVAVFSMMVDLDSSTSKIIILRFIITLACI
jgi:hypothetical protein